MSNNQPEPDQPGAGLAALVLPHPNPQSLLSSPDGSCSTNNVTNFAMDRDKLARRLVTMAESDLPDFTFELKSACHVNLQCSPAFYNAVAKHAVASLGPNYSEQKGDVVVHLPAPPLEQTDQTDLSVSHCYQFRLYDKIVAESSRIGHVSVHLYPTKFLVTAAGSKTVPDGRTAAVWLATEILEPRLSRQRKQANFTPNTSDSIHQAIIKAFGNCASKTASKSKPTSSLGEGCFACKGPFKNGAKKPCPDCFKTFHKQKKCFGDHTCVLPALTLPVTTTSMECVSAPPTDSAQFTFAPVSRKRPALDTTGFRPSTFRDVRSHIEDIDSDEESDSDWVPPNPTQSSHVSTPAPSVVLRSSSLSGAISGGSSPMLTGQQQMQRAINQIAASLSPPSQPPNAAVEAHLLPTPPALPTLQLQSLSQAVLLPAAMPAVQGGSTSLPPARSGPAPKSKKGRGPAGTPDEFNFEMLKKELAASNARVASLDNELQRCKDTEKIMSDRMALFEKRENDRLYAAFSPPVTTSTNPQVLPNSQVHAACCTPTICVTKELASVRLLLEELQGGVNLLLRASPHPPPPPSVHQPGIPPRPLPCSSLPIPPNQAPGQDQAVAICTSPPNSSLPVNQNSDAYVAADHVMAPVSMIVPHPGPDENIGADDLVAIFGPASPIVPAPPVIPASPPPESQSRPSQPQGRSHTAGRVPQPSRQQRRPPSYAAAARAPPRRALLPTPIWVTGYEPYYRFPNDRVPHHATRPQPGYEPHSRLPNVRVPQHTTHRQPARPRQRRARPPAPRTTPQVDEILIDLNS